MIGNDTMADLTGRMDALLLQEKAYATQRLFIDRRIEQLHRLKVSLHRSTPFRRDEAS